MTLIELLEAYRLAVEELGRDKADGILQCTDPVLLQHIRASVSDDGRWLDAWGNIFELYPQE